MLIVTVQTTELPYIAPGERVEIRQIGAGLTRIIVRFGFIEDPDIPAGIRLAIEQGNLETDLDLAAITYVTGRDTVIPSGRIVGMAHWREVIFSIEHRNSTRGAVYFAIPANQVIEIGTEIEI